MKPAMEGTSFSGFDTSEWTVKTHTNQLGIGVGAMDQFEAPNHWFECTLWLVTPFPAFGGRKMITKKIRALLMHWATSCYIHSNDLCSCS